MFIDGQAFPMQPLDRPSRDFVLGVCGVDLRKTPVPEPTPQGLAKFCGTFASSSFDAIAASNVNLLIAVSMDALEVEDVYHLPKRQVMAAARKNAQLYTGVVGLAANIEEITITEQAVSKIAGQNRKNFAMSCIETVQDEAKGFTELIDRVKPAMETSRNSTLHELSFIGSGVVHALVTESYRELVLSEKRMIEDLVLPDLQGPGDEDILRQLDWNI